MFLVNSRQSQFSAAPHSFDRSDLHHRGRPLSRSYGAILPSSLTTVLSSALGFSPHLPVSVLVRILSHSLEDFLGGQSSHFVLSTRHHLWPYACGFAYMPASGLYALFCQCDDSSSRVTPSVITRFE